MDVITHLDKLIAYCKKEIKKKGRKGQDNFDKIILEAKRSAFVQIKKYIED